MNLKKLIFVNNDCYKAGKKIVPNGIMVHSTGANNPMLNRYVGPDDGLLGKNKYNNHWNQKMDRQVCVHGFIGKLANGTIATYQTLPWDHRGWHGGSGPKGSVNNTHISFEICEDGLTDKTYFNKVYQEAVELCAYLCAMFNFNPLADGVIIGHYEGHARGLASNHGDPKNWFPKHGKSMDTFRQDVNKLVKGPGVSPVEPESPVIITPPADVKDSEKLIWDSLKNNGLNDYAVAGIMGNLYAESGLNANNLQNTYNKKLGLTDAEYTAKVDSGAYTNFVRDSAGYGLAQWTYWSRKENLQKYAKAQKKSIGDLNMQLGFLWQEMQGYKSMMTVLKSAKTVREASDVFLLQFERPADQSEAVQVKRAGYGQKYYDKYATGKTPDVPVNKVPYTVKVNATSLNIRKGPGTAYAVTGAIKDNGVYTIVQETTGNCSNKGWGKLKSGAGWISLDYCTKL